MKKGFVALCALVLLAGAVMVAGASGYPMIVCEDVTCDPGEQITVQVTLTDNPGFAYLEMTPQYAPELTLIHTENGDLISDFTEGKQYVWTENEDVTEDGLLMTFTFAVSENAEPGEYPVTFLLRTCGNYNEEPVKFQVQSGTVTVRASESVAVMESGVQKGIYNSFNEAVNACTNNGYVKLLSDGEADLTLQKDLYLDLNGHTLTGTMITNGYQVYGMDSSTNGYSCENMGHFNCINVNGQPVVPARHLKTTTQMVGAIRRYLTVPAEDGYTFHRFYFSITHMSLAPAVTGIGYKAVFYADDMVVAQLDKENAFGFTLELAGHNPVQCFKPMTDFVSGKTYSLRINGFDVERFGETVLAAAASLQLADGTVIQSAEKTTTLRTVVEIVNRQYMAYTKGQLKILRAMIETNPVMKNWDVGNICNYATYEKPENPDGDPV